MATQKVMEAVVQVAGSVDPSLQKALNEAQKGMKGLNLKAIAAGAAVGGAAIATGKAMLEAGKYLKGLGEEFDAATDAIRVGTGATGEALDALVADFDALYASVPTNMDDASQAIADYNTRLELVGPELQEISKQAIQVSDLLGDDLGAVIEESSQAFKQWSLDTDDMSDAMDHAFKVSQSTGQGFSKILSLTQQYGPQLQEMGYSFEEATTMLGQMDKEGVNTEEVLAGLKKSMATMAKEGLSASEGFEYYADSIKNAGDMTEAINIATEVFGSRAAGTMATAIRSGAMDVAELNNTLMASQETISGAAEDTYDFAERLQMMKQELQVALKPMANTIFDRMNDFMPVLADMLDKMVPLLLDVVDAALPFVDQFLSGAVEVLDELLPVMTELAGELLPILSDLVSSLLPTIMSLIKGLLPPMMQIVKAILPPLSKVLTSILPIIVQIADAVLPVVVQLIEALLPLITPLLEMLVDILNDVILPLLPLMTNIIQSLLPVLMEIIGALVPMLQPVLEVLIGLLTSVLEPLMPLITELVNTILPIILDVFNMLLPALEPLLDVLVNILQNAIMPLMEPIVSLVESLLPPLMMILESLAPILKPLLAILEPIATVLEIIFGIIGGIIEWVIGGFTWVVDLLFGAPDTSSLPGYAEGGFTSGLSIAGEDPRYPTEAVLSFNPAYRAENLAYWARAGRMLGAFADSGGSLSGGSATRTQVINLDGLSFAPVIVAGKDASIEDLRQMLEDNEEDFVDMLMEKLARRQGGEYGYDGLFEN